MKPLFLSLLLLPLIGMGQQTDGNVWEGGKIVATSPDGMLSLYRSWQPGDTIPATIIVQYTRRDALTTREVYLINGEPWYRRKGKWIKPKWYRWKIW